MSTPHPSSRSQIEFWIDPPESLAEAIRMYENPADLITRLLRAGSYQTVHASLDGGTWHFRIDRDPLADAIHLQLTSSNELRGEGLKQLEKLYATVRGIETTIDAATYLPPPMRQQRVSDFCRANGITEEFFSRVLMSWSKF